MKKKLYYYSIIKIMVKMFQWVLFTDYFIGMVGARGGVYIKKQKKEFFGKLVNIIIFL